MTALKWKRHDSFEAEANGVTYYIHRRDDHYSITLKIIGRYGRTRWMPYASGDTIEEAKQFCEEASAYHKKAAA